MTIWDQIYKKHLQGGEAWATLDEDIDPTFVNFVEKSNFPSKSAFDIGCGEGKYLKFLQNKGFIVAGIDSSETAVDLSKKLLGSGAHIEAADMYTYRIEQNVYDLVLSTSTLHHGTKNQVMHAIKTIYHALIPRGKIFITLPDLKASMLWKTFKNHQKLEPGTFVPLSGPEKGLVHSFFTQSEAEKLFSDFAEVSVTLDNIGRWIITGNK